MWNKVVNRLVTVKSIVTILTTLVFCVLLLTGVVIPQEFMLIYTSIISFYFGTQSERLNNNIKSETE